MKKLITAIVFTLVLSVSGVKAQEPVQHFVISASAAGYGDASGKTAVSLAGAAFQLTKNVSVGYFNVSNPADSTQPKYHFGVANYTRELNAYLGKKLASKLVFDTSNWLVTIQAGGGKVNFKGVDRVAEVGGIFISRPVANNLQLQCGYQILHGQGTTVLTRNISQQPSVGIVFTF